MWQLLFRLFSSFQTDLDYRCQKEFKWKCWCTSLCSPFSLFSPPLLSSPFFIFAVTFNHDEPPGRTPYQTYLLSLLCLRAETTSIRPPSPPPIVDCICTVGAAVMLVTITGGESHRSRLRILDLGRCNCCCCQPDSSSSHPNLPHTLRSAWNSRECNKNSEKVSAIDVLCLFFYVNVVLTHCHVHRYRWCCLQPDSSPIHPSLARTLRSSLNCKRTMLEMEKGEWNLQRCAIFIVCWCNSP
jgi:hypothetical protein